MYDLLFDLSKRADLSIASAALLILIFFLARQRYLDLYNEVFEEHKSKLDRLEKTFIREGIKLYEEEE